MSRKTKIVEPMGNAHEIAELTASLQPQAMDKTRHAAVQGDDMKEIPVPRYVPDKYSQHIQLKNAIREASSKVGGQLTVPVDKEEINFLKRITEQAQRAEYNRFIETAFDRSDPANRALFLKTFPDFARIREELIDNEANIQTKIAKLQVTGIQSEDDAKFLWALTQGTIQLPDKPLFDPMGFYSKFEVYQNGPFAPPISVRAHQNIDKINRQLGFAGANSQKGSLLSTDADLMYGSNPSGNLARDIAAATYLPRQ